MIIFQKGKRVENSSQTAALSVPQTITKFGRCNSGWISGDIGEAIRERVPIIDGAISRLVRLLGTFTVSTGSVRSDVILEDMLKTVNTAGNGIGINSFISQYFDRLLTYGTAVGEIVPSADFSKIGLYVANPKDIRLERNERNPMLTDIIVQDMDGERKVKNPALTFVSTINPKPGSVYGTGIPGGLDFVSSVLMRIFEAVDKNWERAGNIRYSVNYKPQNDGMDRENAAQRAKLIATEWKNAMTSDTVKDFVSVGDVEIKVIGADSRILDSEVPVRQMLEQIIAKTGLPPFLLGLSWSSTEKMAEMQTDLLTSEMDAYRCVITPVIEQICVTYLRMKGINRAVEVKWDPITLLDMKGEN